MIRRALVQLSALCLALLIGVGIGAVLFSPKLRDLASASADTRGPDALTPEILMQTLTSRLEQTRTAMEAAKGPELARLARQQQALQYQIADPDTALIQTRAAVGSALETLAAFDLPLPESAAPAMSALQSGDLSAAGPVFAAAQPQAEADLRRAAGLAFTLGRIAAASGEPTAATGFYSRAAELNRRSQYFQEAISSALQSNQSSLARGMANNALSAARTEFGEQSPDYAKTLNLVSQTSFAVGQQAEAETLLRQAIELDKSLPPGHEADRAQRLNNLGAILRATGRPADAEPFLRQAIEMAQTSAEGASPIYLSNLAELLAATNRVAEAAPLFETALQLTRTRFGADHPDLPQRLIALANARRMLGQGDAAVTLFQEAAEVTRYQLGPDHPDLSLRLDQIAGALRTAGKPAEAEALYREILTFTEQKSGAERGEHGRTLNNLGLLLAEVGRKDDAAKTYREAIEVLTASLGAEHSVTQRAQANLEQLLAAKP